MNQTEVENAVIEVLTQEGPMEYGALMTAVPGASPERVAVAAWRLRDNKRLKFKLQSRPGEKPLHTVEVL